MAPPRKDLDVWAGNTWSQEMHLSDGASDFDLTGSKLVWRMVYGDTITRKTTDTVDSGIEITDATGGVFVLSLTVAETRTWPDASVIRYEIERWIAGSQTSLLYGNMIVTAWVNDDVDP